MLTLQLSDFSIEEFLAHYWQKKPVLIRQGFPGFYDLIRPDELAGLACEPQIESRLIYKQDGAWQAESGPFESYGRFGKKDWTLVVQAVDHWSPDVADLVQAFSFIPKWRLDDVAISVSLLHYQLCCTQRLLTRSLMLNWSRAISCTSHLVSHMTAFAWKTP